ncbi:MAG: gliding motility-associated C-terminal domain-containing protein, partial [Bacteroidetes bacterium]|nr:gliding motility-associated C-terminal domain-containing protein [Bacteroidota bacterium]
TLWGIVSYVNTPDSVYHYAPGSFYYENNTLFQIKDDNPHNGFDTTDALVNIKNYIPNNSQSFDINSASTLQNGGNNQISAFILAYSTPCPARGGVDSIKTYPPICSGATVQLQGVSAGNYTWSAANNSLNNDTVINPIANPTVTTNYIALVDSAGCKHTEQHRVSVYSTPITDSVQTTLGVCGGNPATATIIAPVGSPNSYTVNGSVQHSPTFNLAPGTYTFALSNAFGCSYSSPKKFTVKDTNLAQAAFYPSPSTGCAPLTISCQNMSNNKANVTNNWVWYTNGDSSISQNFHYTFLDTGVYKISLLAYQNFRTCSAITSQIISVGYCPPDSFSLAAPNIFSPNGDGINDAWQPIIHNYQYSLNSYQCTLYNRWGNKVFTNNSLTPGWSGKAPNGEAAPAGTYFYIIHYKATGNSQGTVQENSLKGFIELIR